MCIADRYMDVDETNKIDIERGFNWGKVVLLVIVILVVLGFLGWVIFGGGGVLFSPTSECMSQCDDLMALGEPYYDSCVIVCCVEECGGNIPCEEDCDNF